MWRLGVVLEDFEGPLLACACGGDAHDPLHIYTLRHMEWEWRQSGLRPTAGEWRKYAATVP